MTPEEKRARIAKQAEEQAALDARTPEEVKQARTGAAADDEAETATVPIPQNKMFNLPERCGVAGLHLYLRALPSTRTTELVQAIFQNWPYLLYVAAPVPLTASGAFDIPAVTAVFEEVERSQARNSLPTPENDQQRKELEAVLSQIHFTPQDILAELRRLQTAVPGELSVIQHHLPGMARTVWMLAEGCPQNAEWTVEKLAQVIGDTFTLPDYAHLARHLLDVNSVGGGYADDLCERFAPPS